MFGVIRLFEGRGEGGQAPDATHSPTHTHSLTHTPYIHFASSPRPHSPRWCGLLISCNTLELQADYSRYCAAPLATAITVPLTARPGSCVCVCVCVFVCVCGGVPCLGCCSNVGFPVF